LKIKIQAFSSSEVDALVNLSQQTFLESHGHSAKSEDIQNYIENHFTTNLLSQALKDPKIHFKKILVEDELAGYSKLILDVPHPQTPLQPIAKFERLYLLKDYYGLGLGKKLLNHSIEIAQSNHQKGLWLFVWTENTKALKFYHKNNFKIIGQHNFKISANHSNPNYVMLKII